MGLRDLIKAAHGVDMEEGPKNLRSAINLYVEMRPDDYREDGWHPSSFCGMCAREKVLMHLRGIPEEPWDPDVQLQKIMDVGSALHALYQNEYLKSVDLWGKWKCLRCEQIVWGLRPKNEVLGPCHDGNPHLWDYKEVPLRMSREGYQDIVGHCDGLFSFIGTGRWYSLELKSINDRGFTFQKRPREGHVQQGKLYTSLIRRGCIDGLPPGMKVPYPEQLHVMYLGKNTSDEKEYRIPVNESEVEDNLRQPWAYEDAMRDRILPARVLGCDNLGCKRAKSCKVSDFCYGGLKWEQIQKRRRR